MGEVVIGAPYCVTNEMLDHFNVSVVCHGDTRVAPSKDGEDPYAEPKARGMFIKVESGNTLTTEMLVQRIVSRRMEYEERIGKIRKVAYDKKDDLISEKSLSDLLPKMDGF